MNGLNLRCTTLCLPSSIRRLRYVSNGAYLYLLHRDRPPSWSLTTTIIMVVLDMPHHRGR
jgi:hypothetical protein